MVLEDLADGALLKKKSDLAGGGLYLSEIQSRSGYTLSEPSVRTRAENSWMKLTDHIVLVAHQSSSSPQSRNRHCGRCCMSDAGAVRGDDDADRR